MNPPESDWEYLETLDGVDYGTHPDFSDPHPMPYEATHITAYLPAEAPSRFGAAVMIGLAFTLLLAAGAMVLLDEKQASLFPAASSLGLFILAFRKPV